MMSSPIKVNVFFFEVLTAYRVSYVIQGEKFVPFPDSTLKFLV